MKQFIQTAGANEMKRTISVTWQAGSSWMSSFNMKTSANADSSLATRYQTPGCPVPPEIMRPLNKSNKMKSTFRKMTMIAAVAAVGMSASLFAEDAADGNKRPAGEAGRHGNRPNPALIKALDANSDESIDAAEIANAPSALATLDANNDTQLTADELHPPRPEGAPKGPPPGDRSKSSSPLTTALDANKDGTLSSDEVANASTALKTIDKNSDGVLSRDEIFGTPPTGGRQGGAPRHRPSKK